MTAPTSQDRAARRWPWRARRAAAGLAAVLATGLVIPALTAAGGAGVAAASAGAAAASTSPARTGAGRPAGAAGTAAAGTASPPVLAWGRNAFGALGDGTTTDSDVPVRVHLPAGTGVTQVRAGCIHTLALTSSGRVLAWGANGDGQLGDGTTTSSDVPVKVKIPRGTRVTSVRAGCVFSLALTSAGQVLAWGDNLEGQLGDGTTSNSDTPVRVRLPAGTTVTAISAGQDFGLARTSRGHVRAWGHGDGGRLGDGSTSNSDTPVKVKLPTGARVKALAAGGAHSLALTSDGLFAWGFNGDGQLGDGTTMNSATPVRIFILVRGRSLGHVTALFAGCSHSLVLFSGGALFAWGDNTFGQLGDGTSTSSDKPAGVALPAGTRVRAVSAGCTDSYALTAKGSVLAWGYNGFGELGDGSDTQSSTPVRVQLPAGWRASAVIAGPEADHALAMVHKKSKPKTASQERGRPMARQTSQDRTTGTAPRRRPLLPRPAAAGLAAALTAALAIPALAIAGGAAMAATAAGTTSFQQKSGPGTGDSPAVAGSAASGHVLAWGRNDFGELGNGTSTDASTPVRVRLPGGAKVQQVRAGCDHTVALTSTGHVLAWGINGYGQLGDGSISSRETPVRVRIPRGTKVTAVRAGCDFSLALTSRGGVLAWGDNIYGQLGNDTTTDSHVPVRVQLPAGTKVTAISAGGSFALARTAGGRVLAWGENSDAELGNGSTTSSDVPLRVDLPPGVRVTIISAGKNFAVARAAGRAFAYFAWGANNVGQYGNGSTIGSATPVDVIRTARGPGHVHLASLFAGCGHTLALFSDGAMLAWGANSEGQLGNGTTTSSDVPVLVKLGRTKVAAISASCDDSYALTRNGHVLAWGYDSEGQLGNGGASSSDTPLRVRLPSGWRASAVGSGPVASHALAIVHRKA